MTTAARRGQPDLAHFTRRLLQDAWIDASAAYWKRRAAQLEAARPRADDFHGRATRAELQHRWQRLTEAADACRNRASFIDASTDELTSALEGIKHHSRAAA